ncbi:Holliday junction branch migration protein RuvA [Crassaminicella thermophila]|uniref:Holliday junction branch migration complex subunit RuvA n=1 Tax=Crassaminicella thermophila TaxID=2599308 RepID=A0A5C0SCW5_CRATE|nr:Holliday junction branch migration protein RuvA [Crassaminicella thermophila]QEK12061.1 Holliday junction branch migration protein RuvA [Crassaminicella thermophila]
MFEYIKGSLEFIGKDYIVVDNQNIGYKIHTSNASIADFKTNSEKVTVYTQLIVREDDMSIFGFSTREELKMFQLLTTVTGIGSKVALAILSSIPIGRLTGIIVSEDVNSLTKAQGVGKKTAQRIILELKDKVDSKMAIIEPSLISTQLLDNDTEEAISALMALGYTKGEAKTTINKVKDSCNSIEEIIKKALVFLSK